MRRTPGAGGRGARSSCAALASALILATVAAQIAVAAPMEVALVAPLGSRLADALARELEFSAFVVERVSPTSVATPWTETARRMVSERRPRVIALRADDRQIIVFSRASLSDELGDTFDLKLESDDRPSRRRACLTVVEYLRALTAGGTAEEASASSRPSGVTGTAGHPRTAAARGGNGASGNGATGNGGTIDRPPAAPAGATAASALPAPPGDGSARSEPWMMGVALTLDVAPPRDHLAGHLTFMWYFPIAERWRIQARAEWPVLGVNLQSSSGDDVRRWNFGAAVGLVHTFNRSTALLQPFVGLMVGNRMTLTEVNSAPPAVQSRTSVTPSATVGGQAGLLLAIHRRVQALALIELAHDWMLPAANRPDYERAAANVSSLHLSAGVLFEY